MTTEIAPPDLPDLSDYWLALWRNYLVKELVRSNRMRRTRRVVLVATLARRRRRALWRSSS
jgi:hypothetical protein